MTRLRGEVRRLSVRRLKDGRVAHDTLIVFDEDASPFQSVRVQGTCENLAGAWDAELLTALRSRYDVAGLPDPRWAANSHSQTDD